jgi:hypothetical protein
VERKGDNFIDNERVIAKRYECDSSPSNSLAKFIKLDHGLNFLPAIENP